MEILSKEIQERVIKILNKIAVLEFKYNSLLSEYQRILNYPKIKEDNKFKELSKEIDSIIGPYMKDYKYKVTELGTLEILQESEKLGETTIYKVCLNLFHNVKLPYAYVMGKACGKRISKQILEGYDYLLN